MPKLVNRNPKLSKLREYAVVYFHGKIHYLGRYGTPEALVAYNRLCAEIQSNPATILLPSEEKHVTVRELSATFLDYAKTNLDSAGYSFYRVIVLDFLDKLYGDDTPVKDFTPRCLKNVRDEMVRSRRFCRNIVNRCVKCVIAIFGWGVENELVQEMTWRTLKAVKPLPKGAPGTFDHEEREPVPDDVIQKTLQFMPPTLKAMIIVQRLTGMRPSEVFNMRVGDIIQDDDPELWYYVRKEHKTERFIGKKVIPLGKPEQELIAPYLEGKTPDAAVFSPRTAMAERSTERAVNRKTKMSPFHIAKAKERAAKPSYYSEFYNRDSYRQAVEHAIEKGNRQLPDEQKIPHWTPYQLRHAAGTEVEKTEGLDKAQALLGHRTANITKRYAHGQLAIAESMARKRQNPFEATEEGGA